jgi:hypothetical protein
MAVAGFSLFVSFCPGAKYLRLGAIFGALFLTFFLRLYGRSDDDEAVQGIEPERRAERHRRSGDEPSDTVQV